ncbi:MAG: leucine-rich repeat protein [Clostridia bacterium]|nr:leucine-rich repeat protein [Clostridia bacterium]
MTNKTWRKITSLMLCVAMMLSMNMQTIALTIDDIELTPKASVVKSDAQVQAVMDKIDAIGTAEYTDIFLDKIVTAEHLYAELSSSQKEQVENYEALVAARNGYNALAADKVDTSGYTIIDTGVINNTVIWYVYSNGILEIAGTGEIPSYSLDAPWQSYVSSINTIIIRSSINRIGEAAFAGCNNITSITLPFVGGQRFLFGGIQAHLAYIFGYSVVASNVVLITDDDYRQGDVCWVKSSQVQYVTSFKYYNGNTCPVYDTFSFSIPSSLKTVTITDAAQIGDGAFAGCTGIERIVINDNVAFIGRHSFDNCLALSDFVIPNNCRQIYRYAFYNCSSLEKIVIPDSVKSIFERVFSNCSGARTISIGSGVKAIPSFAFHGCSGLTSIVVPNTVENIEENAFNNCQNIKSITLPFVGASRTATGWKAHFGYIFGYSVVDLAGKYHTPGSYSHRLYRPLDSSSREEFIQSYTIGTSEKNYNTDFINGYSPKDSFPSKPWYTCRSGSFYWNGSTYYGHIQTFIYNVPTALKTVNITDAIKISEGAFNFCRSITNISLNDKIVSIGAYAFQNVPWYVNFNEEFCVVGDGVLIKHNGLYSSVVIPDSVKYIGGAVFENDSLIREIVLSNRIVGISEYAFFGCTNLTSIRIPKMVKTIGEHAIPNECIIEVYYPSAGYDYRETNRIVLNKSCSTTQGFFYYIADDNSVEIISVAPLEREITIPEKIENKPVKRIGDYAFAGCSTLTGVIIPESVVSIGKYAFSECESLLKINLSDSVQYLGDYAFCRCVSLEKVWLGAGIASIENHAFYGCENLKRLIIDGQLNHNINLELENPEKLIIYTPDNEFVVDFCTKNNIEFVVHTHLFKEWIIVNQPSCIETGLKRHTCTDPGCGKVEEAVVPKISHNYEDIVTAPTCISKGYTTHTCSICGSFYVDTYTDIIPHTEGEWEQSIAPGCTTQGEEIQKCSVCGDILNTRKTSALGHNYGAWQTYTEPTFSQDGENRRYCSRCDAYESQRVPKLSESHTHSFSGNEEIITAPTCTEEGSKKVYCTEPSCGEYTIVVIPALGHSFTENEEVTKDPTCTENGIKRVYCANPGCGEYITDTIPPLGHLEGEWTVEATPTCTETGLEVKKCTRCGVMLQSRTIAATGHIWNSGVVTKESTCTADGIKTFTCLKCGDTITEPISGVDHILGEWEITKEATCTENGTMGRFCAVCESVILEEIIPATGHQYGGWIITIFPSVTTPGEKEHICSVCGHKETKVIDPVSAMPTISINDTATHLDEEITVNVNIADNPGIISMSLKIYYDNDVLELLSASAVSFADLSFGPTTSNPFVVTWEDVLSGNNSTNGTFVQLRFKVINLSFVSATKISVLYDDDNVFNGSFENVFFDVRSGNVEIVRYISGDVNRDGKINLKDYALLKQYINGWNVDIELSVADVTGDGKINLKDYALLKQFINGWNVVLH